MDKQIYLKIRLEQLRRRKRILEKILQFGEKILYLQYVMQEKLIFKRQKKY